ncbi:hypothetical protein [Caenimonas aquaedulcis]|uniref:Uncharacterized protein n=1 Tax=Caenimonas aquaedulcis TaxID=2793270 RepID=A0A931H3Y5_9BURK|nr:hypothetical protein [Caenimonas aquaedulcis]MBG9388179.1 hypothetical protein [Caenimonas aquaedulcis]
MKRPAVLDPARPRAIPTYIPPFAVIRNAFALASNSTGEVAATISYDGLVKLVQSLVRIAPVDEDWYLKQYPDVRQAIKSGQFHSARHHFVDCGYVEGRLPGPLKVDEDWYLKENPDVAAAIQARRYKSGSHHFVEAGYQEGRAPAPLDEDLRGSDEPR